MVEPKHGSACPIHCNRRPRPGRRPFHSSTQELPRPTIVTAIGEYHHQRGSGGGACRETVPQGGSDRPSGVAVAAATLAASGSAASEAHVLQFKGHGVKSLRVFRVSGPSTIFWTNTGSYFQLSTGGDYSYEAAVTPREHEGTTFISPCLYRDVRVRAIGAWTITIRPGVAKLGTPIAFSGAGKQALPPSACRER